MHAPDALTGGKDVAVLTLKFTSAIDDDQHAVARGGVGCASWEVAWYIPCVASSAGWNTLNDCAGLSDTVGARSVAENQADSHTIGWCLWRPCDLSCLASNDWVVTVGCQESAICVGSWLCISNSSGSENACDGED